MGLFHSYFLNSQVEIVPAKGIVFNNDSIILNKCSTVNLCKILKIRDTVETNQISISEYDSLGNLISDFFTKSVNFNGFEFQFSGYKANDILLRNIYIDFSKPLYKFRLENQEISSNSISVIKKYKKSIKKEMNPQETTTFSNTSYSGITFY